MDSPPERDGFEPLVPRKRERFSRLPPARVPRPWPHNVGHLRRNRGQHSCRVISLMPLVQADGVRHSRNPYPSPRTLSNTALARPRYEVILDRSRGPSSRTPDRTNSFWISAESARAPFRRRKSADASITAFIPLSVPVNGAGRSTGCCFEAGLRRGAGLRCAALGRRDEGVETEASRRSRSRHTSSYSWNKGCSCSSFRSSSRRSRSALIRSVIRYSCSNELKRKLLVARKAACKDRQPSAGAGHLRHFPLHQRDRLLGLFPVTLTGDRGFESLYPSKRLLASRHY